MDADASLEAAAGTSVATIFEVEGETGFREREQRLLAERLQGEGQLIATGGGAVLSPTTRDPLYAAVADLEFVPEGRDAAASVRQLARRVAEAWQRGRAA